MDQVVACGTIRSSPMNELTDKDIDQIIHLMGYAVGSMLRESEKGSKEDRKKLELYAKHVSDVLVCKLTLMRGRPKDQ